MSRAALEAETRAMLANRETWTLLTILEVTEATRDDFRVAGNDLGVVATVQTIDWTLDELDRRYPGVMARWHALDDAGIHCDLGGMYAYAYLEASR